MNYFSFIFVWKNGNWKINKSSICSSSSENQLIVIANWRWKILKKIVKVTDCRHTWEKTDLNIHTTQISLEIFSMENEKISRKSSHLPQQFLYVHLHPLRSRCVCSDSVPSCHTNVHFTLSHHLTTFLFPIAQMYDILIVNKNYEAEGPDSISLRVGDLVEVLETGGNSTNTQTAK